MVAKKSYMNTIGVSIRIETIGCNAAIAQLVEQGFCKPQVRGSNPCGGTK